jgi:glycine/D-amino acid oxidase-like deaminating enzyme
MGSKCDYIIVGQGVAGSLMAHRLKAVGSTVKVIDPGGVNATRVSAGNINPVTGRKFTKSWMIDELLKECLCVYPELEKVLNISILSHCPIVRPLRTIEDENQWLSREGNPEYEGYISHSEIIPDLEGKIKQPLIYGIIVKALKVDTNTLIKAYRKYLLSKNELLEEEFKYDLLNVKSDQIIYKDIKAGGIIFCEGTHVKSNPFFYFIPVIPTKGDILHITLKEDFPLNVRDNTFITPQGKYYWVGSNYEKNFSSTEPSEEMRSQMIKKLNDVLLTPYQIVDHITGVRPSTPDRKPIMGIHPEYKNVFLFNGMGTKGLSLVPYFSKHMVEFLKNDSSLMKEVDLNRYL